MVVGSRKQIADAGRCEAIRLCREELNRRGFSRRVDFAGVTAAQIHGFILWLQKHGKRRTDDRSDSASD